MFHLPIPIPCAGAGGGSHGRLGRAQASGNYMRWRPGAPSPPRPARPGAVRSSSVRSGSPPRSPYQRRRAEPLGAAGGCQAHPRPQSSEQSARPLRRPDNGGTNPGAGGSGGGPGPPVPLGERCQPGEHVPAAPTALFRGEKNKTRSPRCYSRWVRDGKGVFCCRQLAVPQHLAPLRFLWEGPSRRQRAHVAAQGCGGRAVSGCQIS